MIGYDLAMRNTIVLFLICAFLASCGGSDTAKTKPTHIPFPDQSGMVDSSVLTLLERTKGEIQAAPENSKSWGIHASALFANDYFGLSVDAFRVALDIDPTMQQARYIMATALWKLNKQEEAIAEVTTFLELKPDYDPAWRLLAQWQLDRGESQLAHDAAMKAFELNQKRIGTRFVLVQSLLDLDRPDDAVKFIEETLASGKTSPWMYQVAAKCYRQLGMDSKLEVALANAGPPPNTWPDPMFQYLSNMVVGKAALTEFAFWTYETRGPVEALPRLRKALRVNPEHVNLRTAFAHALQLSGKLQESVRVLSNLQGEPNLNYWKQFANACIAVAEVSGEEQWTTRAETYVLNALDFDSNDGSAHDLAAKVAMQQGHTQKASDHWETAGKLHSGVEAWNLAEVSFAFVLGINPSRIDVLCGLALAQIKNGQFVSAQTTIDTLSQLDPGNPEVVELQRLLP